MGSAVFPPIPLDTAKAARAVFGRGNFYLVTGDRADRLFAGLALEPFLQVQRTAWSLAIFYLVTVFQFIETLPDHLAAEALRKRVDWKYALHLPLNYPGLKPASFCDFRRELLVESTHQENLTALLVRLSEEMDLDWNGSLSRGPRQLITAVCTASRVAKIWETMSQALEALATRQPEWLLGTSLPHWYERYGHHGRSLDLRAERREQETIAQSIGADGLYLIGAISGANLPELKGLPEVSTLEQVWREQYESSAGKVTWRKEACAGCILGS